MLNFLEEVFKTNGIPTHTFVPPLEYQSLLVALRTPGRGVVIEGPSGIGKTTAVTRALEELGVAQNVLKLSARKKDDVELIKSLPEQKKIGTVLIDDFHRLPAQVRSDIADFLKVLADEEVSDSKVVLIGINKAGESLVRFGYDLNNRLEIVSFETNPDEKIDEALSLGEAALNITLNIRSEITQTAHGSFYIAQMLANQTCLDAGILQQQLTLISTSVSFEAVRGKVFERLSRTFMDRTVKFAKGTRFRREGRAPYLKLLHWLAVSEQWSLNIDQAIAANPGLAGSITQIVEKGYLDSLISGDQDLTAVLHFDDSSHVLSVEDPQYVYFLRNLSWSRFSQDVGFVSVDIASKYDFALSFAGADRGVAERLHALLQEMEFEVFYDHNEQHRLLAQDIEDYLRPIYQSDAQFVVALLGPDYPKRIWTKFESEQFKQRFEAGGVVPIWFSTAPPGMFDETTRVGGIVFDPSQEHEIQLVKIANLLRKKLADIRQTGGLPATSGTLEPLPVE